MKSNALKKVAHFAKSTPGKIASVGTMTVFSAMASAQEAGANEQAVTDAIDGGTSLVQLAVGGVIAIAAVVMGVAIVTRLIGR
ncbi:hypothetical protein [Marinimicrobium agarilyticum]|uniref:hypothetical protein n=1 Tax=Marinimicrobium agarilyticum TaxID=306546 RepID=UPI000406339E|nr:hypothetical protein [Marinimicrobium agarilyticum]